MWSVLPYSDFSTSAYFATLDDTSKDYLSLVIKGESPVDYLYLNGEPLANLTWTSVYGYSTALMEIPHGIYELESVDGRPFAAYIYHHLSHYGGGAGYKCCRWNNHPGLQHLQHLYQHLQQEHLLHHQQALQSTCFLSIQPEWMVQLSPRMTKRQHQNVLWRIWITWTRKQKPW